ncbi:uncharacterized protein K452DRAFT_7333 [Aplosporella prunicola CBS 121167]|uniref:Uncharacterized protein n=1 Tax=Aplosporella prunicola CBS 121167 TaxID=1176127 RepID=A0A6A6BWZ1_9PEZI|nr:uncharacterized protein K452DRAFT_7333 [Aplosporella prunicola CBS 121167]KAF2147427.1 hypothetical protein K452DRAFT_7333 [Aplosporella prunicola CBS 121167]
MRGLPNQPPAQAALRRRTNKQKTDPVSKQVNSDRFMVTTFLLSLPFQLVSLSFQPRSYRHNRPQKTRRKNKNAKQKHKQTQTENRERGKNNKDCPCPRSKQATKQPVGDRRKSSGSLQQDDAIGSPLLPKLWKTDKKHGYRVAVYAEVSVEQ